MYEYSQECLETFLKKQGQLFDEPVAETLEEAEEFLEDCMAVVVDSLNERGTRVSGGKRHGCERPFLPGAGRDPGGLRPGGRNLSDRGGIGRALSGNDSAEMTARKRQCGNDSAEMTAQE